MVEAYPILSVLNHVAGGVVIIGSAYLWSAGGRRGFPREAGMLVLFAAWAALTGMAASPSLPFFSSRLLLTLKVLALGLGVAFYCKDERRLKITLGGLVIASVGGVLLAGDPRDIRQALALTNDTRFSGAFDNPNSLAIRMLLGLIGASVLAALSRSMARRLVLLGMSGVFAVLVLASAGRKFFIALVIWPVLVAWFVYRRQVLRRPGAAAAVLALLCVAVGIVRMSEGTLVMRRFESAPEAGGQRWRMYTVGWDLLSTHPITGVGWGNYAAASGYGAYSHSEYAEVLSSSGLIGGVLYFLPIGIVWRRLAFARRRCRSPDLRSLAGYFVSVVCLVLLLGTGFPLCYSANAWYLLGASMGAGWFLHQRAREGATRGALHEALHSWPTGSGPVDSATQDPPWLATLAQPRDSACLLGDG